MKEAAITPATAKRLTEYFSQYIWPEQQARDLRKVAIHAALDKLGKQGNDLFNLFMLADMLDGQNLVAADEPQQDIDELKAAINKLTINDQR